MGALWNDRRVTVGGALIWIVCLAFLSVGARNFEVGLSIDAPLYASIARNMVRTGEWFRMYGGVPDFVPYTEHTHLGFWMIALVFKLLPAADWSARILGHLYYLAFLTVFFLYLQRVSGLKVAVWAVLLLWSWPLFSNFFSNVYLDPGTLFFGSLALLLWEACHRERRAALAPLAGLSLGVCAIYKGLTVLGFLPAWLVVAAVHRLPGEPPLEIVKRWGAAFLGALLPCALYLAALRTSHVPDFLSLYWNRQMTLRFSQTWSWSGLFQARFWWAILRDTHFLAPLAFTAFLPGRSRHHLWLPATLLLSFILMYAPADRIANQYWLMLLPWLAWLIAEGALSRIPFAPGKIIRGTAWAALIAVCLIQYVPVRTHRAEPPLETEELQRLRREGGIRKLTVDAWPGQATFIVGSPFAWYADLEVDYGDRGRLVPSAPDRAYLQLIGGNSRPTQERDIELRRAGWCPHRTYPHSRLLLACK
jgi:4-amino-4-deoxy-L-arabinose transferase-like glycosyltransferase